MGSLGVCVERTTILQQPPSVDFPTTRASQQPSPAPFSYAKAFRLSFSLASLPTLSFSPFRARTTLRAFQPLGVP